MSDDRNPLFSSSVSPYLSLSAHEAKDHYNTGLGTQLYVEMHSYMFEGPGRVFSIHDFSESLGPRISSLTAGKTLKFETNKQIAYETGAARAVALHDFYRSSGLLSDEAYVWGQTSAGFCGEVVSLGENRFRITGQIRPFDEQFGLEHNTWNPILEAAREIGGIAAGLGFPYSIRFVGEGRAVDGVFDLVIVDTAHGPQYYISSAEVRCFPAHTRIRTSLTSSVSISALRPGDIVFSYDARANKGRGALAPRRVVRIYRNTTTEWVRLTWVEGGEPRELATTPGHHFLDEFGQFPTIGEMARSGRATVVLASGELAEVTAERIVHSAETAHLFERAVAQGAVAGNAAAQPVELDAWATYNFEVEDLHTYVAEGARPGERAAPLWPPGAPVRVRRARTGCLWQTVSDEPPEHKRTAESRCRCRTLPGGTGRERTEHPHSGSSLRPPNRRETTRNRRRWTGAMRWRMWSAA